jgi:uncharacterized protein YerC
MSKLDQVKKLLEQKVPRREIAERTGFNLTEISHFAKVWGIAPYGKAGRPRGKQEVPPEKQPA